VNDKYFTVMINKEEWNWDYCFKNFSRHAKLKT